MGTLRKKNYDIRNEKLNERIRRKMEEISQKVEQKDRNRN